MYVYIYNIYIYNNNNNNNKALGLFGLIGGLGLWLKASSFESEDLRTKKARVAQITARAESDGLGFRF